MEHKRRDFLSGVTGALAVAGSIAAQPAGAYTGRKGAPSVEAEEECCTFIQDGTGAVERTMQDKARDIVSPEDFGAVGDGAADDLAALIAALAVGGTVQLRAGATYRVTGTVMFSINDTYLVGNGAKIVHDSTTAQHVLVAEYLDGIVVDGLQLDGRRSLKSSGANVGIGVMLVGCRRSVVVNCHIHDCWYHAIGVYSEYDGEPSRDIVVANNRCIDNGNTTLYRGFGIWFFTKIEHFVIAGNVCVNNVAGGIATDDTSSGSVPDQACQHFSITGNMVYSTSLGDSIGAERGLVVSGSRHFVVAGNKITGYAIGLSFNSGQAEEPTGFGAIAGNYIEAYGYAMAVTGARDTVISGNHFRLLTGGTTPMNAVSINNPASPVESTRNILFCNNVVTAAAHSSNPDVCAIRIGETATDTHMTEIVLRGNQIRWGGAITPGDLSSGIRLNHADNALVADNDIVGFTRGIYVNSLAVLPEIVGNRCRDSIAVGIDIASTANLGSQYDSKRRRRSSSPRVGEHQKYLHQGQRVLR